MGSAAKFLAPPIKLDGLSCENLAKILIDRGLRINGWSRGAWGSHTESHEPSTRLRRRDPNRC